MSIEWFVIQCCYIVGGATREGVKEEVGVATKEIFQRGGYVNVGVKGAVGVFVRMVKEVEVTITDSWVCQKET